MARIIDRVTQDEVLDNATNRIYAATTAGGTRAANRAAISASHKMFAYDVQSAVAKLADNDAPTYAGDAYMAVLHPFVSFWIKTETNTG